MNVQSRNLKLQRVCKTGNNRIITNWTDSSEPNADFVGFEKFEVPYSAMVYKGFLGGAWGGMGRLITI